MTIMTNAGLYTPPSPGLLRYGLFNAATVTDDLDARAIAAGFQFEAGDCGVVRSYDANCETHPAKTMDEGLGYVESTPYWVYASRQCGTVGKTAAEFDASVRRRLAANEQHEVEAQLWGGGTVTADPQLTTVLGVTTVTPGAPGSSAAIAALEESFYSEYGYVGTIHINTSGYGNLAYGNLLVRGNAGTLTTPLGSVWSIGAGYGTDGPEGVAADAGNVWAFMTPPVLVRRSDVIQRPAWEVADRATNQFVGIAERVYAHAWLCDVVHAVQVPIAAPAVEAVTTV